MTLKERERAACYAAAQEHFIKTFLHFRRAVVVAHRGGYWTLLQNACRELWNYTQESRSIINQLELFYTPFPITKELFLNSIWLAYYMASDTLLDMIVELQSTNSVKVIEDNRDFCVPSCVGGIVDENGGSNLYFEYPFDDVNVVDLRGICNLIVQTIEILFHLEKWESLVSIAMQFNTVTHERYAEQVTPFLVFAQRQLQERIQSRDPNTLRTLFTELVTETGKKVFCRDFVAKNVNCAVKYKPRIDDVHSSEVSKLRLQVSVPVDVRDSLKCFRESLERSQYHNSALRYSRKLLSLFLANTQECSRDLNKRGQVQVTSHGKVGFVTGAELTYQPEPPDLSEETFSYLSSVQSNSIPQSKLSIVITSYEKTLESVRTSDQPGLKVQASHELGNLHFYAGNKRAAFKCWCQALDGALNIADALHHWQDLGGLSEGATDNLVNNSQNYCEKFISQAGIWGCLQGAVLAAKIAQYMLLCDLKLRTKTCILSAVLFKSLFRASLPHPIADCDFAQYETDILIPGVDVFVDYKRADIATVVGSLNFVIYELHCSKQNLIIKVLTDLGFFSDAFNEICIINHGEKIPWKLPTVYRFTSKPMVVPKFYTSQPILTNSNLQVLEDVLNRTVNLFWAASEPRILNNFMLAKMHFIISVAATLNCIPERVVKSTYCTDSDTLRKGGKNADAVMKGFVLMAAYVAGKREPNVMIVELEKNKELLNISMLKGILLAEAEERITFLLDSIQTKYGMHMNEISAAELETVMEAKLQLIAIAQQRLQTTFSTALVYSAIKLLQDANVFKTPDFSKSSDKTNEEGRAYLEDSKLLHNVVALERLNVHLWLKCRLALVTAVTAQARSIETMKESELGECASLISEVRKEAEAFNAVETLAEIIMQAVILGLQERQPVADIKLHLQTIIRLLEEKNLISPPACLTLVQSMLLLADIMRTQAEDGSEHHTSNTDHFNLLILAHRLVIEQLFILGQSIEQHAENPMFTVPKTPFKNIYLPHLKLLAKVKMRIGHALTLELYCAPEIQHELQWLHALKHTENALQLCTASVRRELDLEAELLYQTGKIERQLNMIYGDKSILPVESFMTAIKLSLQSYPNYGMIRRSYLEIALLYFYLITSKVESLSSSSPLERTCKLRADSIEQANSEEITSQSINRVQIWIAVRAAAQVSETFLAIQQLIGKKSVKFYHIKERLQREIPEFVHLDLSSSYKDFLTDGYEVKPPIIVPSGPDDKLETDESESISSDESQGKSKISWLHIIRYHTYLTRLLNMSPLLAVPKAGAGLFAKEDALFTSVLDTSTALRLAAVHSFMKTHLSGYPGSSLQEPPRELYDFEKPCASPSISQKSTYETLVETIQMSAESVFSRTLSGSLMILLENKAISAPVKELCVQWYLPCLEQTSGGELTMVLFVYAYNTKPVQITNIKSFNSSMIKCGYLWIPLKSVTAVSEKLSDLRQHIEILIQSPVAAQTRKESQRGSMEPRKSPILSRSQTGKVQLDDKTRRMVKQCFSEIKLLLSVERKQSLPLTEVPFDITLASIKNLQKLFDPATGCVITGGNVFNWIVSLLE